MKKFIRFELIQLEPTKTICLALATYYIDGVVIHKPLIKFNLKRGKQK